jgi:dihydroorotate dehydrogenase electron transfer subunit
MSTAVSAASRSRQTSPPLALNDPDGQPAPEPTHRDTWNLVTLPAPRTPRPTPVVHRAPVLEHGQIADRYRFLRLHAPAIAERAQPGQFVMLTAARDGESAPVLPRPMALYRTDAVAGTVDVLYGVVGAGTRRLAGFRTGETMTVVGPLGRWFEIGSDVRSVLLVGRGIGTCSLTTVAQRAADTGVVINAVTSARHKAAVIGADLYREFGARSVHEVTDEDGTSDVASLFTRLTGELDADPPGLILTCGSERLVGLCERLAGRWRGTRIQVSVEAHMACGLGYCHGCASGARSEGDESPLICKDGPVFAWTPQAEPTDQPAAARVSGETLR